MIIDAKNLRLGRMANVVAKRALMGEEISIINCSQIVITGSKASVLAKFKRKREMGTPSTGPFFPRGASAMVKRSIRGMLPYKQERGRSALARIKCYNATPASLQDQKTETIDAAHIDNSLTSKYVTIGEISKFLGGKSE